MPEITEAILDGSVCQECEEFFPEVLNGGDPPGYPRTCEFCFDSSEYDDIFVDREDE